MARATGNGNNDGHGAAAMEMTGWLDVRFEIRVIADVAGLPLAAAVAVAFIFPST